MAKLNATLSFDLDTYAGVDNETLVIDARTREIYIPDPENVFGVQYDKDSKYIRFRVINTVSEIFKMEDALIRVNYRDSKNIIGSSITTDKVTYYDTCEFAWIVPNNALKNKGDLYFVVSAVIVDDDGIIQKRWATTLSRVVTPESIYSKSASLDQNERDEIAMLLLLVSEKCNQAVEDIREARDTGVTTISNIKDSGIEELNDLISKYGIRFEDLSVLKSRVDQLFDSGNLPNANTEVTDIRIGYDGTIYSTAGNAVRIQISNIMGMILDNQFHTPLLIDRDSELIDEENNILQADWQYKVDGNQSLNCDGCDVGVPGNATYELEGLINQAKNELNQIKTDTSTLKDEANTSATNAKASEDKAKEYADNLQASTDDISKLKEDLVDEKNAINSITEPTKNLFDVLHANIVHGYIHADYKIIKEKNDATIVYINCKPNTTYTVSKTPGHRFSVACSVDKPQIGTILYNIKSLNTGSSVTITTTSDANYLVAWVWTNTDSISETDMLNTVQIEVGSDATTYEKYKLTAIDYIARGLEKNTLFNYLSVQPEYGSDLTPKYGNDISTSISEYIGNNATWENNAWNVLENGSIETTLNVETNSVYLIEFTVNKPYTGNDEQGRPGYLQVDFGSDSQTFFAPNDAYWYVTMHSNEATTIPFKVTSVNHWTGNIANITVKKVLSYSKALVKLYQDYYKFTSGNNISLGGQETMSIGDLNTSFGKYSQQKIESARWNTAFGSTTQMTLRNGTGNTAVGSGSQGYITNGCYNNALGNATQSHITTGCWNNAIGNEAQLELTEGCNNVNIGRRSGTGLKTGNYNTHVGTWTGFSGINTDEVSDGRNTTTASFQTLVGGRARQIDHQSDYLVSIGFESQGDDKAIALGARAKAKGNESVAIGYGVETKNDNEIAIGTDTHSIILCGKKITFNSDHTVTWEEVS